MSLAYLLALVALLVPVGRWSDRYGRKLVYLYGFGVFSVASAGCGLAPSLAVLIRLRVVQAAGAAMLQANSVALVATSAPGGRRRAALGIQAAAQALGLALGPMAGGLLVTSVGWRWIFFVNLPAGVVATLAGWFLLPRTRRLTRARATDVPGMTLLTLAVGGVLVAVSSLPGLGLPPAALAGSAAAATAAGAGLIWWERRSSTPLIDLPLLAAAGIAPALGGALCGYMVLFGPLVLLPQTLAEPAGTVLRAGLLLTALPAGFGLAAVAAERILPAHWTNSSRCVTGGLLAGCSAAMLAIPGTAAVTVISLALLGAGLGAYMSANNAQIMAAIPAADAATAGGMVNMARGLGTALGVTVVTLGLHAGAHLGHADGGRLAIMALVVAALAAAWAGNQRTAAPVRDTSTSSGAGQEVTVSEATAADAAHPRSRARPDGLAEGVARLRRALRRGARVADPDNPLAVAQLELLSALTENPGARPGQLARLLHMRPNTVTTIVNALADRGMVSRAAADGDRRAIKLAVTPAGEQAVHAWQATNAAVLHLALSTLPARQRRALAAAVPALTALAGAVDRLADIPSGPPPGPGPG